MAGGTRRAGDSRRWAAHCRGPHRSSFGGSWRGRRGRRNRRSSEWRRLVRGHTLRFWFELLRTSQAGFRRDLPA
jgi:hypothetical protein